MISLSQKKRSKSNMNESIEWILQLNLSEQEESELREILDAFSDSKSRSEWEDISLKEQYVFAELLH